MANDDSNPTLTDDTPKKADYYESRAESAGKGGISSDDPAAVVKLRAELEKLEEQQAHWVAINKAHKAFLRDPATLDRSTLSDEAKATVRNYKPAYSWEPHPVPPYRLSNNNGNMGRIRKRIEQLQRRPTETTEREILLGADSASSSAGINDGGAPAAGSNEPQAVTVREDATENRVMLIFPGKPSDGVRQILKSAGFRWSPYRGAWVRFLNDAGRAAAQYVVSKLTEAA